MAVDKALRPTKYGRCPLCGFSGALYKSPDPDYKVLCGKCYNGATAVTSGH